MDLVVVVVADDDHEMRTMMMMMVGCSLVCDACPHNSDSVGLKCYKYTTGDMRGRCAHAPQLY